MTNFIPDTIIPDAVTIKILRIASSDCDVNGKCLNSPYFVKHHGKLYRAACWTTRLKETHRLIFTLEKFFTFQ